jgi:CheY-like chemotaxis protein
MAVILVGIVVIVVVGNAMGVWFLAQTGKIEGVQSYVPVIYLICTITPLLSAAAAFFVAVLVKRRIPKQVPFDLHELFTECRTLIAPKAAEKGIILHFYAEPVIRKKPLGDPDLLFQTLVILLSNAVKYTNTGMVKLHSAIKEAKSKTIIITFEVKDSGIGITGGHKYKAGDIVKMMGGKLSVESSPGIGSKFSFDLTLDTIDVSAGTAGGEMAEKENVPDEFEKPVFEGEVLLCEDSVLNQQIICEHLARVGLKTVVAENGKIGVEMVQNRIQNGEKQFNLIFMDIHMPVMDGLEAASKILSLDTGIPIVAMTANIMSNDLEIYKSSGIYDSVGKPFTSQQLWQCLNKYFKPIKRQSTVETNYIQVKNELRQKIILHFIRDNRTIIADIKKAISLNDIELARRLAHTLKGGAGQLDKFLLQQAAENVEQRLKDGSNRVTPQQMTALETELNAAMAEFIPLAREFSIAEEKV